MIDGWEGRPWPRKLEMPSELSKPDEFGQRCTDCVTVSWHMSYKGAFWNPGTKRGSGRHTYNGSNAHA